MANVFLTGATGFIGSFVAYQLIQQKHHVTCLVRATSNLKWLHGLPLHLITGSILDPQTYLSDLRNADYVIHLAGVTKARSPQIFYQGNVECTEQLLSTLADQDTGIKKFLLVSSQAAVGPSPTQEPVDEDFPCQPLTQYGKSKWQAEQIALSYQKKLPLTILRPCAVYGPRDIDVLNFFKTLKYGFNLMVGQVDQLVNVVYVEDCARGIIQATFSEKTAGKTYFVCEDTPYYWSQFATIAGKIMNKKYMTIKLPYPLVNLISYFMEQIANISGGTTILNREKMREVREPYWRVSVARAQLDFQYQTLFPAEKGIEKTIGWYKENNWL